MNILIVENQTILRDGIVELIRTKFETANISALGDGLSALSSEDLPPPDLAILDINLPHLDGIETARRLIAQHPNLKVLFLTMHSDSQMVNRAFEAGANGYFLKDEKFERLIEAIDAINKGQNYLSPQLKAIPQKRSKSNDGTPTPIGLHLLTKRQIEILKQIASGLSIREIASATGLSTKTLDAHRREIQRRLGVDSTAALTRIAVREGLTDLDGRDPSATPADPAP